ncbi:MAG: hypothetical protein HY820_16575 [Acidobacteria bacterium]|nr:hypothetical protein [Acidobacteriota bacterium]
MLVLVDAGNAASAPTFRKDIAPILFERCGGCHRPGDIAPFSVMDYKSVRPWAKAIRQSVVSRKMPPWFADPKVGHWANDARLSEREIAAIQTWVDGGAAEGSGSVPQPPRQVEGWHLGQPDIVIDIGEDYQVTPGEDAYEHFVVRTNFAEGKWIRAAEIRPGNRQVVHHVHVLLVSEDPRQMEVASTSNMPSLQQYLLKEGKLSRIRKDAPVWNDGCATDTPALPFLTGAQEGGLAAFLPGRPPDVFPDGSAKWIPPGAKLEFVIHYARISGKPQRDRTSVGLYLAPGKPGRALRRMDLRNFFMQIPAGAANHEVRRCYEFEADRMLLSFTPHMHYRGKDVKYEVVRPDGRRETLLWVPKYDFNWQLVYRLRDPVLVEKGSRLIVTAHYDNSVNNAANPDPKEVVRWGDKSEEEMMTSWIEYLER